MDQIFLDVLCANPSRGGAIFFSLFSRAEPARVIRFPSGRASLADSLAMVAAMPVPPFLNAAPGWVIGSKGSKARPSNLACGVSR